MPYMKSPARKQRRTAIEHSPKLKSPFYLVVDIATESKVTIAVILQIFNSH